MLTCIKLTWTAKIVFCFCIFTVNDILAVPLTLESPSKHMYTESEAGFDLNEEDFTKFHIWPKGNIPYYIDDFSFDKVLRDRIRMFLDGVNRITNLHFVEIPRPPEDEETRWVFFLNRKGLLDCADHPYHNFTNKGVQKVVLGYQCLNSDENLADIVLSMVGVPPQHNAPNRDKFISVQENNILPDKLYLFEKLKDNEWLFRNLTYDIDSAGHFGPYKYTANGRMTVQRAPDYHFESVVPPSPEPKEKGFTSNDIWKIAMLYNYIVRNRETAAVPECSKLFAAGSKLSNTPLERPNDYKKPREKPSQYLGIPKTQVPDHKKNCNSNKSDDKKKNDDNSENENKSYENSDTNQNEENEEKLNNNELNDDINSNEVNDNEISKIKINHKTNSKLVDDNDNHKDDFKNHEDSTKEETFMEDNKTKNDKEFKDESGVTQYVTTADNIRNFTRRDRLAVKIDESKKQKLLTQSDYETGDEGNNKYIHEKNL